MHACTCIFFLEMSTFCVFRPKKVLKKSAFSILEGMTAYGYLLLAPEEGWCPWPPGGPFGPSLASDAWGSLHQYFVFRLGYPHAKFQNIQVIFYLSRIFQ